VSEHVIRSRKNRPVWALEEPSSNFHGKLKENLNKSPGKKLLITGDILCGALQFYVSVFSYTAASVCCQSESSLRSAILVRSWTKNSLISRGLGFVTGNVKVTATVKIKAIPLANRKRWKGFRGNCYSGYGKLQPIGPR